MAGGIPEDVIDEIRLRSDIVEIISSYIPLKRAGGNSWKACCPFHNEKTPSFHVRGDKQAFHCFGCGKGGDVFRFVMERENIPFPEAVHLLASRCGVIIPENSRDGDPAAGRERANKRDRLYQLNEEFAQFFEKNLIRHPEWPAAQYLATRALSEDAVRQFRLGAAPDEWDGCLRYGRSLGFSDAEMLEGGIVRKHEASGRLYDHFKGRLTFAIWNEHGKVVGFSARSLEAKPQSAKYVNTAETPVFKKGNLLYALPFARQAMQQAKGAILCEGQLDTIAFHRAGCAQAVAPQGTGFTPDQARLLRRYTDGGEILLAFDADNAGQKAVNSALEILLPQEFTVKVIRIPGGKDPDELFRHGGADAVQQAVAAAVPWLPWLVERLGENQDLSTPEGCTRAVEGVVEKLLLIENPVLRELLVRESSGLLHVSENAVLGELTRRQKQARRIAVGGGSAGAPPAGGSFRAAPGGAPATPAPRPGVSRCERAELTLLGLALNYENAARELAEKLMPEELESGRIGEMLNLVLAATMNGEHAEAGTQLAAQLTEAPDERISKLLVSDAAFEARQLGKVIRDCLDVLKEEYFLREQRRLSEAMRTATDPELRMQLLMQLAELQRQHGRSSGRR